MYFLMGRIADTVIVGTGTFTGASTGDLTITDAAFKCGAFTISDDSTLNIGCFREFYNYTPKYKQYCHSISKSQVQGASIW